MAKFFTWVDQVYTEQAQVPNRLVMQMRAMWLDGASIRELSEAFNLPFEWVDDFVRRDTRETSVH